MNTNRDENKQRENYPSNKDLQAVDKTPGEERGKGDQVTTNDLKGKKKWMPIPSCRKSSRSDNCHNDHFPLMKSLTR